MINSYEGLYVLKHIYVTFGLSKYGSFLYLFVNPNAHTAHALHCISLQCKLTLKINKNINV